MNLLSYIKEFFSSLPLFGGHEIDVTAFLPILASRSSALGAIIALLMLAVLWLMNKYGKWFRWLFSGKFLTTAFLIVWLAGFVIYDVGMYIGHNWWSLIANAPMAVVHAFEMFILESDVAAIHNQFHDNGIFMLGFSAVHFAAAFITLIFVIKHFGFNIVAGFKMMFEAYCFRRKKETFVFWGMNDASYLLAQSIKAHFDKPRDCRIIIVRTNQEDENTSAKNGLERLFNFLSLNNTDLERLEHLDCLTTSTYADLANLKLNEAGCPDILRKHMSLKQLARIIRKKTSEKVHLFFLSDDTDVNIQAVGNLKRDKTINAVADAGKKVFLYCQARYNSVHRVIEDEQLHENILVKVVDSSHISVEMLKQQEELQPVSFVVIEKDATVSSAFNALVIGFGEVGYDAVRFLYEFGAFVKTGSDADRVERSDFHCDIVDKDIRNKAGLFAANAPSVSNQMSYNDDDDAGHQQSLITLHDMDVLSVDFYNHLEHLIGNLNYVVIALDDDVANVSLAVRIFRLAVRYREDLNHFRILVRVRNDNDGHLLKIAEHYNRLWEAQVHSDAPNHIHQLTVKNSEKIHEPITLFGSLADTFTYDYIVSDRLKAEAKQFKEKYDQSISALNGKSGSASLPPLEWEREHRELMQLTPEFKGYSPTLSGIMRLRRVQSQNMENCFHKFTKQRLAKAALGEKYDLLTGNILSRKENEITYSWQGQELDATVTRVIDVIAWTEHLRWVASHEILGYRDFGDLKFKDEARLLHGCLKPWHELTTPVQSYDYNVVDVSLGII